MIKFDINELKDCTIIDEIAEIENYSCKFFYDETNNNRKLWLKELDFNSPINEDFVIGGVMHFGETTNADVEKLKQIIKLQKNSKELKCRHVAGRNGFLDCLRSKKVYSFLKWLYDSDLYVHYSNVNNLYFAIVDIIDSVVDDVDILAYGWEGINLIKSDFFRFVTSNYEDVYELLYNSNYPNIESNNVKAFCEKLLNIIEMQEDISFGLECFRQSLKKAKNREDLVFLRDNPESTILENYSIFYLRPIYTFKNACHTFDRECQIEKDLEGIELYDGENKITNYTFVESEDNMLVQISDVIVGLIGRYFTFVNSLEFKETLDLEKNLSDFQMETLSLFAMIILKSEKKCRIFLHSCESMDEYAKSANILELGSKFHLRKMINEFIKKKQQEQH